MREHEDFLPELDFVMEVDGHIVGNIMYTKAKLKDEAGQEKEILTFGPLCIKKEYQRKGYGKKLIEHSFNKAAELGYDVVVIFGSPSNYVSSGFKSCKKFNVCLEGGIYPADPQLQIVQVVRLINSLIPQLANQSRSIPFLSSLMNRPSPTIAATVHPA